MFYVFYLDDAPKDRNRLLRLDNGRMARAYVIHLHRDLNPARLRHVRVKIVEIGANGARSERDMGLTEFEAEEARE